MLAGPGQAMSQTPVVDSTDAAKLPTAADYEAAVEGLGEATDKLADVTLALRPYREAVDQDDMYNTRIDRPTYASIGELYEFVNDVESYVTELSGMLAVLRVNLDDVMFIRGQRVDKP
jgi:hypothetical protein